MIGCVRPLQDHRRIALSLLAWGALLLSVSATALRAQSAAALHAGAPQGASVPAAPAVDTSAVGRLLPLRKTGDVLTPNTRRNTPDLKLGIRAGINRSNYTNDRYLNNVPLDVGDVSGETDIYSSAAGFGYQLGIDVEYPLNSAISLVFGGEFSHVAFGSSGTVQEPCVHSDGSDGSGTSVHEFHATFDYLKVAATGKLSFTNWYFIAGLTAEHPLATSLERTRRMGTADCYYPGNPPKQLLEEKGEIPSPSAIHYAFRLGAGINYRLTDRLQFAPELTLDFGINTINKSPNSDLGVYGISATLRYDLR